jgi:NADH-quinone oxidoreductase subunit H
MADILINLFKIIVFPGFIFLSAYSLLAEFVDRKLYARFQNRIGPPWFQPLADFIKLLGKETIIPESADRGMFRFIPLFAISAVCTAFLYIPVWGRNSLYPFNGDVIVVLYLLTIPTLTFFLAGWFSSSVFSCLGSVRTLTQLFAYEVPLFMAILGPAILAGNDGNWSISGISAFYASHPLLIPVNIPAFFVALVAVQGKLERVPFDIPEAETEIVAGSFTEYTGKLLALFRISIDIEMVVAASLMAAVFFPFYAGNGIGGNILGIILFVIKTMVIVFLFSAIRASMARLRIEQMVSFCWRILTPIALVQVLANLILKEVIKL